jgi:Ca2+-binding RTX toxin-like protein
MGDDKNNNFNGLQGNDTIIGGNGNDNIRGGNGDDSLSGGKGDDIILGQGGNDYIAGGEGEDTLTGGSGKDSFAFKSSQEGGDTITDFSVKDDVILISEIGFDTGKELGTLSNDNFVIGSAATESDDFFVYDQNLNALFFDPDGNGNKKPTLIAEFTTSNLKFTNKNIMVNIV